MIFLVFHFASLRNQKFIVKIQVRRNEFEIIIFQQFARYDWNRARLDDKIDDDKREH